MYEIYNRKVAEHAQLFPVFHCFETAFRSYTAVHLEDYYRIPQWWGPAYREITAGTVVSTIGVVQSVPSAYKRAIRLTTSNLMNIYNVMSFADGYEMLENADLYDVQRLVLDHWPIFKSDFKIKGQPITSNVFRDKFDAVRNARNSVYHHKSFSGMTQVYEFADELLACIKFALPAVHKRIADTACADPPYWAPASAPST